MTEILLKVILEYVYYTIEVKLTTGGIAMNPVKSMTEQEMTGVAEAFADYSYGENEHGLSLQVINLIFALRWLFFYKRRIVTGL